MNRRIHEALPNNNRFIRQYHRTRDELHHIHRELDSFELNIFFKPSSEFNQCSPLPSEIMVRIFKKLVSSSEDPINELVKVCQVCEGWRQIVLHEPSLWNHLDNDQIPLTPQNLTYLTRIHSDEFVGDAAIEELRLFGTRHELNQSGISFLKLALKSPKLKKLVIGHLDMSITMAKTLKCHINDCTTLESVAINKSSSSFRDNQWFLDFLTTNGARLQHLDLSFNYGIKGSTIEAAIFKHCPNLIELNLGSLRGSNLRTNLSESIDAQLLASSLQKLEILSLAYGYIKPVLLAPSNFGLAKLRKLSIPLESADPIRDDKLLKTLTYGSKSLRHLNIAGSMVSVDTILNMPTYRVESLKFDDIDRMRRKEYPLILMRWSKSLTKISLINIDCPDTIGCCLRVLVNDDGVSIIRKINLSGSTVNLADLKSFFRATKSLRRVKLRSHISLNANFMILFECHATDSEKIRLLMKELNIY